MGEPDYGTDVYCGSDLDPLLRDTSGVENMQLVCLRRLYTPLGHLLSDPTAVTLDARDFVSSGVDLSSDKDLVRIQALCQAALLDDQRIFSVAIQPSFDFRTRVLTLPIQGVGSQGPFSLVLGVSALTVELLTP